MVLRNVGILTSQLGVTIQNNLTCSFTIAKTSNIAIISVIK